MVIYTSGLIFNALCQGYKGGNQPPLILCNVLVKCEQFPISTLSACSFEVVAKLRTANWSYNFKKGCYLLGQLFT